MEKVGDLVRDARLLEILTIGLHEYVKKTGRRKQALLVLAAALKGPPDFFEVCKHVVHFSLIGDLLCAQVAHVLPAQHRCEAGKLEVKRRMLGLSCLVCTSF